MGFELSRKSWEWLARCDPLWAICTDPRKRGGRWTTAEFFATGEREIEAVFRYLDRKGIAVTDRSTALDFGCGVGRLTRALASRMDEVYGVDVSPTMIRLATELNAGQSGRMHFVLNEERDLRRFADRTFSFIYSSIVLQHVPYPASLGYVGEFMRLLKPGGALVFQTPTLDRSTLAWRLLRSAARQAVQRLRLPFGRFYMEMSVIPEEEIGDHAKQEGVEILDVVNTNSTDAGADGTLKFFEEDRGGRLISRQFVVRRPTSDTVR